MKKREKILVILTIAVAIGAGLFLYLNQDGGGGGQPQSQTKSQAPSPSQEALDVLQEKGPELKEVKPSEYRLPNYDQQLIKAASKPWPEGIFYHDNPEHLQDPQARALHYGGYMQVNGQYLAIINGHPFASGEHLYGTAWSEYRIESITPERVVLATPQGKQRTLALQADPSIGFHESNALAGQGE